MSDIIECYRSFHSACWCFMFWRPWYKTHYNESMNDSQKIIWLTLFLGKGGLGSTKFVAFETLAWHNECFFCNICKDSMVGKGFIQVNTWFQESKNVVHITIMGDRETLFFSGWWKHHLPWVRKEEDDGGDWGRMNNKNPTQFWMFTYSLGLMFRTHNLSFVYLWCAILHVSASGSDVWMVLFFGCLCDPVEYILYLSYSKDNTLISHLCNSFISKDDIFVALMFMQQC